jgi:LacI family transcriptional regulator, repressor for deo operon, udp, cdd, tsx, nupC, and nupG
VGGDAIDGAGGGSGSTTASATIEDVAARARVSVATVSRALRGLPNVAPSTRERVLVAARALHYVADPSAARLASGRSHAVGLVVPTLGRWYYGSAYSGVEAALTDADYDLLPFTTGGESGATRFLELMPFRKRVDGLILVDVRLPGDQLRRVVREGVQVVSVGVPSEDSTSIHVDNVAAARMAAQHLIGLGHVRVAVMGAAGETFGLDVGAERLRGYREAMVAAELDTDDLEVYRPLSLEGGAEAMQTLLHRDRPPSAVFAMSDEMAIGAMQVARDAGLRIPEDVSVVGFDDHDVAAYLGLTTVRQDVRRMGERAATLLLQRLRGEVSQVQHEVASTRLVVRRTTGPPPRGRRWRR